MRIILLPWQVNGLERTHSAVPVCGEAAEMPETAAEADLAVIWADDAWFLDLKIFQEWHLLSEA